jgi:hypothetical protein
LFRSLYPRKYPLRTDREGSIQPVLADLNLPHDAVVCSPPHPFGPRGWNSIRPGVIRAEPAMQTGKAMVRTV